VVGEGQETRALGELGQAFNAVWPKQQGLQSLLLIHEKGRFHWLRDGMVKHAEWPLRRIRLSDWTEVADGRANFVCASSTSGFAVPRSHTMSLKRRGKGSEGKTRGREEEGKGKGRGREDKRKMRGRQEEEKRKGKGDEEKRRGKGRKDRRKRRGR
jgi:hypothetical protein